MQRAREIGKKLIKAFQKELLIHRNVFFGTGILMGGGEFRPFCFGLGLLPAVINRKTLDREKKACHAASFRMKRNTIHDSLEKGSLFFFCY